MVWLWLVLCQDAWVKIPSTFDTHEKGAVVSFYPVKVSAVKLSVAVPREQLDAFGAPGRIKIESSADGVITFKEPVELAELQIKASVKSVDVFIPKNAERSRPPKPEQLDELGDFKITFYWVLFQEDFKGPEDTPILMPDGKELARAPKKFVEQLHIEGTGKLKDGRVINTSGNKRYRVVEAPYGLGVSNYHLIPFKSIAVDKKVVPIGTRIFIKEAVGIKLPDGSVHDGVFYAHDVGGGIDGKHIDILLPKKMYMKLFNEAGIRSKAKLFKVTEP